MIASTREVIKQTGTPYAIENVPDARRLLNNPMMLCGTMFGLPTQRHRYFEIWPECFVLQITCQHDKLPIVVTGTTRRATGRLEYLVSDCRRAMDIDWMTRSGLDNAIPPAYTEFVGNLLIAALEKWRQVNNGTQS